MTDFHAVTVKYQNLLPDRVSLELAHDVVSSMVLTKIEDQDREMIVIRDYLFLISNLQTERISPTYFSVKEAEGSVFSICIHKRFSGEQSM